MYYRLRKPWFVHQPTRLVRRVMVALRPPSPGYTPIRTSWGVEIVADPTRAIGRSILTTGIYDLAVSEALARLISSGDTVIDAGANVGYMTVLASVVAGPGGRVISFEPHPELFSLIQRNVAAASGHLQIAHAELHQAALGAHPGAAQLHVPPGFESNDGIASIRRPTAPSDRSLTVPVETLDRVLADRSATVLKLDVEGFEPQVLQGAAECLASGRIRHILFEEHAIDTSAVSQMLCAAGYRLFSLGWSLRGPRVQPVEGGSLAGEFEAPSFIATLDPSDVVARCRSRGWLVLSSRLAKRRR